MAAALKCIREHGAESLSLRALAREVGVSQTAPYRHFEDKVALLSALASDGFLQLAQQMKDAMGDRERDPIGALQRGGLAYIHFAVSKPETYRLMYSMPIDKFSDSEMQACHHEAFQLLERTVESGLASGKFKAHNKDAVVMASWSLVHGYAQLLIDGVIDLNGLDIQHAFESIGIVMNEGIVGL